MAKVKVLKIFRDKLNGMRLYEPRDKETFEVNGLSAARIQKLVDGGFIEAPKKPEEKVTESKAKKDAKPKETE